MNKSNSMKCYFILNKNNNNSKISLINKRLNNKNHNKNNKINQVIDIHILIQFIIVLAIKKLLHMQFNKVVQIKNKQ